MGVNPSFAKATEGNTMAKKKRKNRKSRKHENKKTKRLEVKKDQPEAVVVDVRSDLRKTAILTAVCLGILLVLYLTRPRWLTSLSSF